MFDEYKNLVLAQDYNSFPLKWNEIFGNDKELAVEIGFGNGEFAHQMSLENDSLNIVGFEMSINSVIKAQRRFFRDGLENLRILMTDGRFGLRNLFEDESVSKVILNFPVPWTKAKHFQRRVAVPEFFKTLSAVLTKDGTFELATDVESYALDTRKIAFEEGFKVTDVEKNEIRRYQTRFEKKWIKYERDIYSFSAFRQEFKKAERLLEGEVEMPHAVISKNFSEITKLSEILDTPFKSESKKQICIYKSIYREGEYENFVIRTIAVDDDFEQQFYINIFERNNERIIKLDGISNPYRTPAVKFAVLKLAELLKK